MSKPRNQDLPVQIDAVHGGTDVANERKGKQHGDELAKPAGGPEHGFEDTSGGEAFMAFIPPWDVWDCATNGGAENLASF